MVGVTSLSGGYQGQAECKEEWQSSLYLKLSVQGQAILWCVVVPWGFRQRCQLPLRCWSFPRALSRRWQKLQKDLIVSF